MLERYLLLYTAFGEYGIDQKTIAPEVVTATNSVGYITMPTIDTMGGIFINSKKSDAGFKIKIAHFWAI